MEAITINDGEMIGNQTKFLVSGAKHAVVEFEGERFTKVMESGGKGVYLKASSKLNPTQAYKMLADLGFRMTTQPDKKKGYSFFGISQAKANQIIKELTCG